MLHRADDGWRPSWLRSRVFHLLRDRTDGSIFRQATYSHTWRILWDDEVTFAPLNQRGWVLQERSLARRIIQFCRSEVFWECETKAACESFTAGIPSLPMATYDNLRSTIRWFKNDGYSGDRDEGKPSVSSGFVWETIVKQYSRFQLTKTSDKAERYRWISDSPVYRFQRPHGVRCKDVDAHHSVRFDLVIMINHETDLNSCIAPLLRQAFPGHPSMVRFRFDTTWSREQGDSYGFAASSTAATHPHPEPPQKSVTPEVMATS
jgi:hypothetical protein